MMRTRAGLLLAATSLLLQACVNQPPKWEAASSGRYVSYKQGFSAELPPRWLQLSSHDGSATLVSADGPELDLIDLHRWENDKAFQRIKKAASPTELPGDLAADFIAEGKTEGNSNVQVIVNEPATLGGKDGFRVVMEFSTPGGVRYRSESYGVCTPDGFYALIYRAPVLHYYDLYEPAFKAVVASFQLVPRGK